MKLKLRFALVSIFVFCGLLTAQRTVTNADLERYKDQRVRAEDDLRVNYLRLGFPSPEELERREAERDRVRHDLALQIRRNELEEARVLNEWRLAMAAAYANRPQTIVVENGGYYGGGFLQAGFRPGYWPGRPRGFQPTGYYAGGQFWPTGNQTPMRPMFGGRRH